MTPIFSLVDMEHHRRFRSGSSGDSRWATAGQRSPEDDRLSFEDALSKLRDSRHSPTTGGSAAPEGHKPKTKPKAKARAGNEPTRSRRQLQRERPLPATDGLLPHPRPIRNPRKPSSSKQKRKPRARLSPPPPPPPPLSVSSSSDTASSSSERSSHSSESQSRATAGGVKRSSKSKSNSNSNSNSNNSSSRSGSGKRGQTRARALASSCRSRLRPKQRRGRRKTIRWDKSVGIRVVRGLENYSLQEIKDTWYSPDEYALMEDECELTSEHMDELYELDLLDFQATRNTDRGDTAATTTTTTYTTAAGSVPGRERRRLPDGLSERGLESWTLRGEALKEARVQLIVDTVWKSQVHAWTLLGGTPGSPPGRRFERTSTDGRIHDECWEYLRRKSIRISALSRAMARRLAASDEEDVRSYLDQIRVLEEARKKRAGGSVHPPVAPGRPSILRPPKPVVLDPIDPSDSARESFSRVSVPTRDPRAEPGEAYRSTAGGSGSPDSFGRGTASSGSEATTMASDVNPRRPQRFESPSTPPRSRLVGGIGIGDDLPVPFASDDTGETYGTAVARTRESPKDASLGSAPGRCRGHRL